MGVVRQAVAATAQPAAVRGSTRYHELPDAGHWVSACHMLESCLGGGALRPSNT